VKSIEDETTWRKRERKTTKRTRKYLRMLCMLIRNCRRRLEYRPAAEDGKTTSEL
jgi:hypothetical protein